MKKNITLVLSLLSFIGMIILIKRHFLPPPTPKTTKKILKKGQTETYRATVYYSEDGCKRFFIKVWESDTTSTIYSIETLYDSITGKDTLLKSFSTRSEIHNSNKSYYWNIIYKNTICKSYSWGKYKEYIYQYKSE